MTHAPNPEGGDSFWWILPPVTEDEIARALRDLALGGTGDHAADVRLARLAIAEARDRTARLSRATEGKPPR